MRERLWMPLCVTALFLTTYVVGATLVEGKPEEMGLQPFFNDEVDLLHQWPRISEAVGAGAAHRRLLQDYSPGANTNKGDPSPPAPARRLLQDYSPRANESKGPSPQGRKLLQDYSPSANTNKGTPIP